MDARPEKPTVTTLGSWFPLALLIVAAGVWVFSPAFFGGWIWDDQPYISDNPIIQDPEGFWKVWVNPDGQGNYYPLTSFAEWLQWQWWGNSMLGYHLTNVFLHLASAFLLWRLFARLGIRLAWLGALLFTVHPVMIESVAWISELKNTLSLPPLLMAMLAWLTWTETGARRSYLAAIALFVVAMLAKTSGVMFPILLLGYAWSKRGRIDWPDLRAVIPCFVVAALAGVVTLMPHAPMAENLHRTWSLLPALAAVGWSIFFMLGKCAFPFGLLPVYEGFALNPPTPFNLVPWLLLAPLAYLLWSNRAGGSRYLLFGLGFFFLNLAPVLVYIFINYSIMVWSMEHLVYLPIIGLIGLAIAALGELDQRLPRPARIGQWAVVGVVVGIMAWSSHAYAGWFADAEVFWNRVLQRDPQSWIAELDLGTILNKEKRYADALPHLQKLVALQPNLDDGHYSLGIALDNLHRIPEAEDEFHRSLAINPKYAKSYLSLGHIQRKEGHSAEAEKLFGEGLKVDPDNVPLLIDMAGLLFQSGRVDEAIGLFQHASDLDPNLAQLQFDLGNALLQRGDFPAAADHFARALDLDPTMAPAHGELGVIFAHAGHLPEAMEQFQAALQLNPALVDPRMNLALALAQTGRITEAIDQFGQVLQLDPANAKARDSLAKLQQYQLQQNATRAH